MDSRLRGNDGRGTSNLRLIPVMNGGVKLLGRAMLLLIVAAAVTYALSGSLLTAMGRYLVNDEPLAKADAIVVLAGSIPDRILEAVSLYKEGYAPRILLSRGRNPAGYSQLAKLGVHVARQFELNRSVAEQAGVPAAALSEVGGNEDSTVDEAEEVLRFAGDQGVRTLIVVTSKHHSRRASIIYRHLADPRMRIISRPSRYDEFTSSGWWRDRTYRRRVVIEWQKLVAFTVIDRWRFKPVPLPAVAKQPW
jgi:uncharacterized SAM-binding protein YcdF (DUF218 family)